MISKQVLLDQIKDCNKDRTTTFAEFVALIFKDKFIEIYLGDSYESVSTEQISEDYPAVFCGKVVAAYRECLVINAAYVDKKSKHIKIGNLMFISERAIRALNEIDGNGVIEDMFLRSKESLEIRNDILNGNE
jgi:hypothetical protein